MSAPTPGRPLYLKFRTSHIENMRYLRTLGLLTHEKNHRKLPSLNQVDQMLAMVSFLKSKGLKDCDFSQLALLCPQLFSSSVTPADIAPVFDFLTVDVSASVEESCGLINKCPSLLLSDVENCLKPTHQYLKELGVGKLNSPTTLNAFLLNTRLEKIYDKRDVLAVRITVFIRVVMHYHSHVAEENGDRLQVNVPLDAGMLIQQTSKVGKGDHGNRRLLGTTILKEPLYF
ncbi:hypothetical protein MLD38_013278 [Melastoma candidum]|uniref:Uncharacterized protein n=1 Tax=Melastoma candidum TaxID=119954 RepID=A0ACB9R966_9MYRT|nr:hypothetical protein MLD38_013278 [Melastoma candidum]